MNDKYNYWNIPPNLYFVFITRSENWEDLEKNKKLMQSHPWMCMKFNIWLKNVQFEQKMSSLNEIVIQYEPHTYALKVPLLNYVRCSLELSHNVHRDQDLLLSFEHLETFKIKALFQSIWNNEIALITKFISLQWMLGDCYIEYKKIIWGRVPCTTQE